jgi:hypothetical protein
MWFVGDAPIGILGMCKSDRSSSALLLAFLVLEVDALT